MIKIYKNLVKKYPIISIEDPFEEDDFLSFAQLKNEFKDAHIQVVGDDLTVSNPQRIQEAIQQRSINALLLKLNQIGTLSEAIEAANLAKKHH